MTAIDRTQIGPLHRKYCELSGIHIPLPVGLMFVWEEWLLAGFNEADLARVVHYLQGKIRTKQRSLECLRFSRLIQDTEAFQEHLSMANALARRPRIDAARAEALKATGRSGEPPQAEPRPVRDVIKASQGLAALRALKDSL